jgi:hypothetical protein
MINKVPQIHLVKTLDQTLKIRDKKNLFKHIKFIN